MLLQHGVGRAVQTGGAHGAYIYSCIYSVRTSWTTACGDQASPDCTPLPSQVTLLES